MGETDREMVVGVVVVLRAVWGGAILLIVFALVPCSCLASMYDALSAFFAKRGKTMQYSSQKFTVPQRFFSHYYTMATVWTTTLLLSTWMFAYKMAPINVSGQPYNKVWSSVFLLLLMEVHVMRRLFETAYVFNYSPSARMHIIGYVGGMCYYVATPLSLCCTWAPEVFKFAADEVAAFSAGGIIQIKFDLWGHVSPLLVLSWYQWVGASIYICGWTHQLRCHAILGSLRKRGAEQTEKYAIPHGDWFELVSSPHYLAEIVIYFGIVVASGGTDLTIWLLFVIVVANLAFAAVETHKWYLQKFDNYPRNRHAIIPFVY